MKKPECEFVDAFIEQGAFKHLIKGDPVVFREIRSNSGVPDVIIIDRSDLMILREYYNSFDSFSFRHVHTLIIKCLNKRSYSPLSTILAKTGMSETYIKKALNELKTQNIVIATDRGWKLSAAHNFPNIDLVSLEFKMDNWQSALRQGFRYKKLSTKSYVVMPDRKSQLLEEKIENFRAYGVGLATFSVDNRRLRIKCPPQKSKPQNTSYSSVLHTVNSAAQIQYA